MSDEFNWQRLAVYLSGECSLEERAAVEAWIAADPGRVRMVAALQHVWAETGRVRTGAGDTAPPVNVDAARRRLGARFSAHTASRAADVGAAEGRARSWAARPPARTRRQTVPLRAAAVVIVTLGVVAGTWRVAGRNRGPQQVREFATSPGNRAAITLRDGTKLVLGPASRLRLAADFGMHSRTVDLDGEAYFAVVHDAVRPFTVRAHGAVIRDVGTTFDVRAYAGDRQMRVAVAEGRVDVVGGAGAAREAALRAGDIAIIDTALAVAHGANVAELTGWTEGRLSFDATPLPDVLAALTRWYGMSFRLADSALAGRDVTMALTTESPAEVATILCGVVGARCERDARHVTLVGPIEARPAHPPQHR